ncbi:sugar transferase [Tardiphaga sp.]|uniref:sugar transferase n=1 Tax=Tardiphaga sp. TaxID=1926292 RepID=UPI00263617E6|nr:sugar transferase [Tardiphaga sp.]
MAIAAYGLATSTAVDIPASVVLPVAAALAALGIIAFTVNREFPITFAGRIIGFVFLTLLTVLTLSRIPYSISLIFLSLGMCMVFGSMLSINLAKYHGDRTVWVGDELDGELEEALGNSIPAYTNEDQDLNFDVLLVSHFNDGHKSEIVAKAQYLGREIITFSKFYEHRFGRVYLAAVELDDLDHSLSQRLYIKMKRCLDLGICIVASPVIVALCILISVYIVLVSGFPVLFRQKRIGYGNQSFLLWKFRTMGPPRAETAGITTQVDDARIFRGARLLRRYRLDELPQFINILRGEMSLIGPRPEWSKLVEEYSPVMPQYNYRHLMRPGLTGWAQVKMGYAGDLQDTRRKVSYDLYYIKYVSFELDLRTLLKTVHAVLYKKNAR